MKFQTAHTTKNYHVSINILGNYELYSYNTLICVFDMVTNTIFLTNYWLYSPTTKRHLYWFFEEIAQNENIMYDLHDSIHTEHKQRYLSIADIRKHYSMNTPIFIDNIPFYFRKYE